jgi:hypothetical protein
MRMPRPRFTLSRMMVAVMTIGVLLAIPGEMERRSSKFLDLARSHSVKAAGCGIQDLSMIIYRWREVSESPDGKEPLSPAETKRIMDTGWYHKAMETKYRRAARFPWLPVWPDPPEPN